MLFSKLREIIYFLKKKIITILGDIEWHNYPFFLIYNPKHYALRGHHFQSVSDCLKPYDVLLRRFDKYLDNGFIPGYWNHAGIYLPEGNILHAIAEGVKEESLFDFMKADAICVLRPKFKFLRNSLKKRKNDILGKEYDFNFDFTNGDRLSCTELVREFFKDLDHQIPLTEYGPLFFSRKIVIPDTIYSANFEVIYDSTKL